MREFFAVFLFVLNANFAMGQEQEIARPEKPGAKEEYCIVSELPKPYSTRVNIAVDFGQEVSSVWKTRNRQIVLKNEDGNPIEFNSVVAGLNYMASHGWELVHAYARSPDKEDVCYLMKRKLAEKGDADRKTVDLDSVGR